MIQLQSSSRYLLQILSTRLQNLEKGAELDCQWVEFNYVRYHIQANVKNPNLLFLSVSIPTPPPERTFVNGLPPGAIEAIKATYGVVLHILDPPIDGFNLTVKLSLSKLPQMKEFVAARQTPGLSNALPCLWSPSPPQELQGACSKALSANSGFVSFVIFSRHVEGRKMDRTVRSLLTFHAYVSYHVKCSEGFMHIRMRCCVESLIEALDRTKPDSEEKAKKNCSNQIL